MPALLPQDYSIGEKGCWSVDGRFQDYRKQTEEPGTDGEYVAVHNLYFQEHGGRRQVSAWCGLVASPFSPCCHLS